jgi:hypothetical protein
MYGLLHVNEFNVSVMLWLEIYQQISMSLTLFQTDFLFLDCTTDDLLLNANEMVQLQTDLQNYGMGRRFTQGNIIDCLHLW